MVVGREGHSYTKSNRRRGDGAKSRVDSRPRKQRVLGPSSCFVAHGSMLRWDLAERSAALKLPVLLLAAFLSRSGNSYGRQPVKSVSMAWPFDEPKRAARLPGDGRRWTPGSIPRLP